MSSFEHNRTYWGSSNKTKDIDQKQMSSKEDINGCSNDKQKQPNSFVHSNTALYREEEVRTACFVYLFIFCPILYNPSQTLSDIFCSFVVSAVMSE